MFITFEGPDGSGKTTALQGLKEEINKRKLNNQFIYTKEPGGTEISDSIRNLLLQEFSEKITEVTEVYLFAASRSQHVERLILPGIKAGKTVISDRFLDSSIAYQGSGRKLGVNMVKEINKYAIHELKPDLTFYFDVTPEIGLARINTMRLDDVDRLDKQDIDFYKRVVNRYKKIIEDDPSRFVIISADKSYDEVLQAIINTLERRGIL